MSRYFLTAVVLLTTTMLIGNSAAFAHSSEGCKMGVFPFLSSQRLETIFAPIAAQLGAVEECPSFHYHSAKTFESFMKNLGARKYEIAYIQPFDYVRLAVPKGYLPLAARNSQLVATLVARADTRFESLEQLRGKTIALPPPVAAVSYLTLAALAQAGIDPEQDIELVYTKNHGSCLQRVLIGKADACATVDTVIRLFENKNRLQMKWVAQTPAIPQTLFVVRDDISAASRQHLLQRLLTMQLDEEGRKLFQAGEGGQVFRAIDDSEYDKVRQYWRHLVPIQGKEMTK